MGDTEEDIPTESDEDTEETNEETTEETTGSQEDASEQFVPAPAAKKKGYTKQQKKLVRRKVSKKEKEGNLPSLLRLAVESGSVDFGTHQAIVRAKAGKSKVLVLAQNAKPATRDAVRESCAASNTPLIEFPGTSIELGSICGRPHTVAVLAVDDVGAATALMDFAVKKK